MNAMRTFLLCLPLLVTACTGGNGPNDAGGTGEVIFKVTGVARVHPVAADFLADAGQTLNLIGLTARVEEPLKVALSQPDGVFSTQLLDGGLTFSATNISSFDVSLAVAAGIFDATDAGNPRVIRSATVLFDVALEEGKPTKDITGTAYAVPTAFHDKLTAAVGAATIRSLNESGFDAGTLIEAGFILGRVVDATGKPVSGITISPADNKFKPGFVYPTADLNGVGAATSSNGLFLYINNGSATVAQFSFTLAGQPTYKKRNAGAAHDACLVADIYPGTTAP